MNNLTELFAPKGKLRAAINLGNPILATRDTTGQVKGVSVDLASNFARSLGVPIELVVVDSAGKSVDVVASEAADIGFFAVDPLRGEHIAFTAPYVLIEGCYMVRQDSPITRNEQVDRAGVRVTVGKGSAYDLYLSREIKHATLVRAATSPTVVDEFIAQQTEVAAGVRQQLEADSVRYAALNLRLLPERFMVIQQAMGVPKSRGIIASTFLRAYVEEMKATGFVAQALARHKIQGATVAPAA